MEKEKKKLEDIIEYSISSGLLSKDEIKKLEAEEKSGIKDIDVDINTLLNDITKDDSINNVS